MHEASLVEALFDEVEAVVAPHPIAAVRRVRVRMGAQSGVEPELFAIAFDAARADRGLPTATLELVPEPVMWACPTCDASVPTGDRLVCPRCGGAPELRAGDALLLERVALEFPDV